MGIQRDPLFGPVALFGLGGIFVEVLQDVVFRRCPFEVDEAEAMIRSIRGAPLLLGARGRPQADVAALARLLSNLAVRLGGGRALALGGPQPGHRLAGGPGRLGGGCGAGSRGGGRWRSILRYS